MSNAESKAIGAAGKPATAGAALVGPFLQAVAPRGYEWFRQPTLNIGLLRPVRSAWHTWKRYEPMKEESLFQRLAEVGRGHEPTPEEIVDFAITYGLLGIEHELSDLSWPTFHSRDDQRQYDGWGTWERETTWKWEILVMRHAIRVWHAINDEASAKRLRLWFRFGRFGGRQPVGIYAPLEDKADWLAYEGLQPGAASYQTKEGVSYRLGKSPSPGVMGEGKRGEYAWFLTPFSDELSPKELARLFLERIIGVRLRKHCQLEMVVQPSDRAVTGRPNSLVGAIWLQLALQIQGNTRMHSCNRCKSWFVVRSNRPGMAQHKRFCSTKCRVAFHRADR